ncbi:hypothetical protein ACIO02_33980 [Streptomyces sp. NPDC087568]|uniref:hypothetical protein n=1 Tax=Streptomyces sp. NPDC087568 TaxID=3365799 RepID=UPI00382B376D
MHRAAAACCLAAGVWMLATPAWGVLALGAAVWVLAPREREREPLAEPGQGLRERWKALRQAPRRAVAVAAMTLGTAGIPAGVALIAGTGPAVLAGAAALIAVALLVGWNA